MPLFWTVNPGWFYAALGGFFATVILHTVAVSGVLFLRIRDILVSSYYSDPSSSSSYSFTLQNPSYTTANLPQRYG